MWLCLDVYKVLGHADASTASSKRNDGSGVGVSVGVDVDVVCVYRRLQWKVAPSLSVLS